MHSCIYEGRVSHRRLTPARHAFRYRLFFMYLDLAELDQVFTGRWLWSSRRPALAWFRREDHLGDPARPLADCVRDLVASRLGFRPAGPVRLLTQLRYFGYVINPVSFYYCFDAADARLEAVVAEVHNTPWGERHCYTLDGRDRPAEARLETTHSKEFHVSPFMGMEMQYRFRLTRPDRRLVVQMASEERGTKMFSAVLQLERREATPWRLAGALMRYPAMTLQVLAAIYWQALRLWCKGCRYHPHPGGRSPQESAA